LPNLPERYQSQVAAQANRRIIETPQTQADTSIGDALQHVGKVALEIQERIQKSQQDQQILKAERETKTRLDKLKYDLEADAETPSSALPVRYRQESDAIIKEMAAGITSETARNMWTERAKGWQGEGENWTLGLKRKRDVDGVRAGYVTTLADIEKKAGDTTISAETFKEILDGGIVGVRNGIASGMIAADIGAEYEARLQGYRTKDLDLRTVQNVDALIAQGRVAEARSQFMANYKDMSPETRAKMDAGLKASEQDFAVVTKGDEIWDKANGDFGKAIKLAAEEKDPATRIKLETRLGQKQTQAKVAEDARQDGLQDQLWKHVVNGGTIMSASAVVRGAIDPSRMGAIRAYESARDTESGMTAAQKAQVEQASNVAKYGFEWLSRQNPRAFMEGFNSWPADYQTAYKAMTPADQLSIMGKRDTMVQTGVTSDAIDKVMQDVVKDAQRAAPSLMSTEKANASAKFTFEGILYKNAKTLSQMQGGVAISPEMARKIVLQSMAEYDQKKFGAGVNVALGYMQADDARGADPDTWAAIAAQQTKTLGRTPTQPEILKAYLALTGK
jgi:hypothetical protein